MAEASRGRVAQGTGAWHGVGGEVEGVILRDEKESIFFFPLSQQRKMLWWQASP